MTPAFMVDSAVPANSQVQTNLNVWDDICAWAGAAPQVYGRYLGDGHGAATPLNEEEVIFLHSKGCGILLIYNDATSTSVAAGWGAGVVDANTAIAQAQALKAPAGTLIVANVEAGWQPHRDWMEAYCETILQAGYLPGFYGAVGAENFASAYLAAMANDGGNVQQAVLWSANWTAPVFIAANMPAWNPSYPSLQYANKVAIWQCRGVSYGICDLDEILLPLRGVWAAPETAPPVPQPKPRPVIAKINGTIDTSANKFWVDFPLQNGNHSSTVSFAFDTGAFEILLTPEIGTVLGLANDGNLEIMGVTGSEQAFQSTVQVQVGDRLVTTECVVAPTNMILFGLRLFIENGWAFELDTENGVLTIYGPEA